MSDPEAAPAPGADGRGFFLPDFCEARAVLAIVLIAALLAIVLALARQTVHGAFWIDLARTSAYLLWTGLACAAVLCKARPRLAGKPLRTAVLGALGLMVGTVAAAIVGSLTLRYFYVTSEWRRSVELEARSRIRALQARIRPHFLFNSLNTVASLTRSDPARAEEAIEDLADLFRVSLSDARAQISLREELEVARIYQRIEQLRLGDRLQVRWKVADLPADAIVPSLLLQPLLENAIGHGIEPLPEGGTVLVEGSSDGEQVTLRISNPVSATAKAVRSGNRMALDNIRQRLELAFPGRASVTVDDGGERYQVTLQFPLLMDPGRAGRDRW